MLFQWLDTVVLNWLTRIYNQGSLKIDAQNARVKDVLKEFRVKLEYYLYETYAHIIIDQFFTVIIGKTPKIGIDFRCGACLTMAFCL